MTSSVELDRAVISHRDLPSEAVDTAVTPPAEHDQVVDHCRSVLDARADVVSVAPGDWCVASGEAAAGVARDQRGAHL